MLPLRLVIVASIYWITIVSGSSVISYYQEQINSLSQHASQELQQLRTQHSVQINEFVGQSLILIGNSTTIGRQRLNESFEYIFSVAVEGELNDEQEVCVEEALHEQMFYADILDDDLSECAEIVYNETSLDTWQRFQDVEISLQRVALQALNQGMVAFEVENTWENRERHLQKELESLSDVWEFYSGMLEEMLAMQREVREEMLLHVEKCLEQAILFYNYTIEYVKDNLHGCISMSSS